MNLAELLSLPDLDEDLARLEEILVATVAVEDPLLSEVARHLVAAGGKRLRPALGLAAAATGGRPAGEEVLLGAVAVELVHLASLYHDDVMDEAPRRRNVDSVNARWGNLLAIVAGDFLLSRSAAIAAELGTEVSAVLATTLGRLCRGQVSEVRTAFDTERTVADYLAAIGDKTASLMSASCRIAALTAGLDRRDVEVLTAFGEAFGMVFQVRDDVLDVIATDQELGKPPGQDLIEGVYTLPVLHALSDPVAGPELAKLLGQPMGPVEMEKARSVVAGSGGVAAALEAARHFARRAAEAALALGPGPVPDALSGLGHAILDTLPVLSR